MIPKSLRKRMLCLLFVICGAVPAFAAQKLNTNIDYILVINSYAESTIWSRFVIDSIRIKITDPFDQLNLYTESLNMWLIDDTLKINERKNEIIERYREKKPKAIVLLGNSTWMLFQDELKGIWKEIPTLFCSENDYIDSKEAYVKKEIDKYDPSTSKPLSSVVGKSNLTVIQCPLYIKKTIELMRQLLPQMQKLAFISDSRYISAQARYDLQKITEKHFPDLEISYLTDGELTTDMLIDSLQTYDSSVGILFLSWIQKHIEFGNITLSSYNHKSICSFTQHPLFVLDDVGLADGEMAGGYLYLGSELGHTVVNTLRQILKEDDASRIPWQTAGTPHSYLCYNVLHKSGIPSSYYPKDAVYFFEPEGFFSKNRYTLAGIAFLIGIIYVLFMRIRLLNKNEEIRQSELKALNRYRDLINNTPIVYMQQKLICNSQNELTDFEITAANPIFEKAFVPKDTVIGWKGSSYSPNISDYLTICQHAIAQKQSYTFEYHYNKRDRFYEIYVVPSSEKWQIDVFCVDITELRKTQTSLESVNHKLAMALDIANVVPWKWDIEKKTILCDVNQPIELRSISQADENLSVPEHLYFAKIHKSDRERVKKAYERLIKGETEKIKEEYRVLNKAENHFQYEWVEAQATIETKGKDGKPKTLIGSSVIISERKRMEIDLREAKDRAEESNRLKSAFLANMSHEIRTPLNAIVGFSNILSSAEEETEKQEYISIIENNNALLLQLIGDILDLSKIESGALEFSHNTFDLNTLFREQEQIYKMKLSDKVTLSFERCLPECNLRSDKNRFMQVLSNLLSNAVKFTEKGFIRFGYYPTEDRSQLRIYVTDSGCGIPAEKAESIFGRFVKLNNFKQGSGLGLSICQTIVKKLGGEIGVNSKEGEGSTFWFTVPFTVESATPAEHRAQEGIVGAKIAAKDKPLILIAEDNLSNHKLFDTILKEEFRLLHAYNGKEAVDLFAAHLPHLVLMDINMPVMDGYEATAEIRKLSKDVPIIAVTAYAFATDEERIMQCGFNAYTPKPINAGSLKSKIGSLLEKYLIFT